MDSVLSLGGYKKSWDTRRKGGNRIEISFSLSTFPPHRGERKQNDGDVLLQISRVDNFWLSSNFGYTLTRKSPFPLCHRCGQKRKSQSWGRSRIAFSRSFDICGSNPRGHDDLVTRSNADLVAVRGLSIQSIKWGWKLGLITLVPPLLFPSVATSYSGTSLFSATFSAWEWNRKKVDSAFLFPFPHSALEVLEGEREVHLRLCLEEEPKWAGRIELFCRFPPSILPAVFPRSNGYGLYNGSVKGKGGFLFAREADSIETHFLK